MMEVRQVDQATLMFDKPCLDRSGTMSAEQVPVFKLRPIYSKSESLTWKKKKKRTIRFYTKSFFHFMKKMSWKSCHNIARALLCSCFTIARCFLLVQRDILSFGRKKSKLADEKLKLHALFASDLVWTGFFKHKEQPKTSKWNNMRNILKNIIFSHD